MSPVVVGRMRAHALGESAGVSAAGGAVDIDLLRTGPGPGGPSTLAVLRRATLSWESGAALGEPLERQLGWRGSEPFVLVVPTPALAGGLFFSRRGSLERREAGAHHESAERQWLRDVVWEVREQCRESARRFFGCALEHVDILGEELHPPDTLDGGAGIPAAVCLARGPGSAPLPDPPADLPQTQRGVLPLMIGEIVRPYRQPRAHERSFSGILLLEEHAVTFAVWGHSLLRWIRTVPLGATDLVAEVRRALSCSPAEALTILSRADAGVLSPDMQRVCRKALRPLFPIFSGAWRLMGDELPANDGPTDLSVAGIWPALLLHICARTAFRVHCLRSAAVPVRALPRPPISGDGGRVDGALRDPPTAALVEYCAAAVLRHYASENPEVILGRSAAGAVESRRQPR